MKVINYLEQLLPQFKIEQHDRDNVTSFSFTCNGFRYTCPARYSAKGIPSYDARAIAMQALEQYGQSLIDWSDRSLEK